jgi:multicomponent Na+:H+ antiporter subunit F
VTPAALGAAVAAALVGLAVLLAVVRLVRGPDLANRVVAVDMLSALGVGITGAAAVASGDAVYLDVALVLALITFLGTVAFARYAEQGGDE